ncbi:MAG: FAD-dependent oxidoreductase [Spirochaetales bacterium]|nr:FAD-dependent oxidoreductase [Spirochaetales bacterium]
MLSLVLSVAARVPCVVSRALMEGPRTARLSLRPVEGEFPAWAPGQSAMLALVAPSAPRGARAFPVVSPPYERGRMEFLVKAVDDWTLRFVAAVESGLDPDCAALVGAPFGPTWLGSRDPGGPLVLVAGGFGIAAFLGLLEHLAWADAARPTLLLWWAKTREELGPSRDFGAYARTFPGFSWKAALTHDPLWDGERGRPDAESLARLSGAFLADPATRWFVSGPPPMAKAVRRALRALGIARRAARVGS